MKSKWTMKIGAFLLLGAMLAGCGTTNNDDNLNDQREDDVPIEQNERDNNIDDRDDQDNNQNQEQNQDDREGDMRENDNNLEEQLDEDQMNRNNNR